jgi:hypothetical protein
VSYVAVSYIWGKGGVESSFLVNTLVWKSLPQTIRDTMAVVRKLGYRYLWVDRYCIPENKRAAQIKLAIFAGIWI